MKAAMRVLHWVGQSQVRSATVNVSFQSCFHPCCGERLLAGRLSSTTHTTPRLCEESHTQLPPITLESQCFHF